MPAKRQPLLRTGVAWRHAQETAALEAALLSIPASASLPSRMQAAVGAALYRLAKGAEPQEQGGQVGEDVGNEQGEQGSGEAALDSAEQGPASRARPMQAGPEAAVALLRAALGLVPEEVQPFGATLLHSYLLLAVPAVQRHLVAGGAAVDDLAACSTWRLEAPMHARMVRTLGMEGEFLDALLLLDLPLQDQYQLLSQAVAAVPQLAVGLVAALCPPVIDCSISVDAPSSAGGAQLHPKLGSGGQLQELQMQVWLPVLQVLLQGLARSHAQANEQQEQQEEGQGQSQDGAAEQAARCLISLCLLVRWCLHHWGSLGSSSFGAPGQATVSGQELLEQALAQLDVGLCEWQPLLLLGDSEPGAPHPQGSGQQQRSLLRLLVRELQAQLGCVSQALDQAKTTLQEQAGAGAGAAGGCAPLPAMAVVRLVCRMGLFNQVLAFSKQQGPQEAQQQERSPASVLPSTLQHGPNLAAAACPIFWAGSAAAGAQGLLAGVPAWLGSEDPRAALIQTNPLQGPATWVASLAAEGSSPLEAGAGKQGQAVTGQAGAGQAQPASSGPAAAGEPASSGSGAAAAWMQAITAEMARPTLGPSLPPSILDAMRASRAAAVAAAAQGRQASKASRGAATPAAQVPSHAAGAVTAGQAAAAAGEASGATEEAGSEAASQGNEQGGPSVDQGLAPSEAVGSQQAAASAASAQSPGDPKGSGLSALEAWEQRIAAWVCAGLTPGLPCPWPSMEHPAVARSAGPASYCPLRMALGLLGLAAASPGCDSSCDRLGAPSFVCDVALSMAVEAARGVRSLEQQQALQLAASSDPSLAR